MTNKKTKAILLALIIISKVTLAISAIEAVNLIVTSSNYLYDGETYSAPNVPISYEDKEYWVIPLTAGNEVLTYFPVEAKTGKLSETRETNRGLMKLSDFLREMQLLKSSIATKSIDWPFTETTQKKLEDISQQFKDETFQINTAETMLKTKKINGNTQEIKNSLKTLTEQSYETSQLISEAKNIEEEFFRKPTEENLALMQKAYQEVFAKTESLNNNTTKYRGEIDKLKQIISVAEIETQEKAQLSQLIEAPQSTSVIRKIYLDSIQIKNSIDSITQKTNLKSDALLIELENRIAKNKTHQIIYSENEKLAKEGFSTLNEAQAYILDKANAEQWVNQEKVAILKQNYSKAIEYYKKRNYTQAEKYAKDATENAIAILKEGKIESKKTSINNEFLLQIAGVLIVLLLLLYTFNNRGKITEALKGKKEEIEIYD